MKIAILTPTLYGYDGIAKVAKKQAENYVKMGHDVKIFALGGDMAPVGINIEILGTPKFSLLRRIYWLIFPMDFFRLIKWVKKLKKYDIVISHNYPMNCLASLAKKSYHIKYVYYNHGAPPPEVRQNLWERTYQRIFKFFWKMSLVNVDSIISVSRYLKEDLKRELKKDSSVVYNKVNINRFHERVDGSNIREKYSLANEPIILFVGRVDPYKGVHLLIKAFKMVKKDLPNAKLLIVGKQNYDDYLQKLKEMSDNSVRFIGYVTDRELPHYYGACDVYSTASLWEGFDLPLIEAQACGKPVIAFDLGSHREVVDDRVTGILVRPMDYNAFGKAMIRILKDKDLAKELGRNGYKKMREKFA